MQTWAWILKKSANLIFSIQLRQYYYHNEVLLVGRLASILLEWWDMVVSIMADFVLLSRQAQSNKLLATQGHSSVAQLLRGNGASLSYWSLPMVLLGNDHFCCFSVNRIISINHIYRLVAPCLLIKPFDAAEWSMQTRLCTANPVSKMSIDGKNNLLIWDILIWEVRGFFCRR